MQNKKMIADCKLKLFQKYDGTNDFHFKGGLRANQK